MMKFNQQKSGVYFGEKPGTFNTALRLCGLNRSIVKPIDEDGHIALIGGSGSGKTQGVVLPTICRSWKGNFLAIDIKGDLKESYDKLNSNGNTKVLSFRGDAGTTYDPFEIIREGGEENRVSHIQELAASLLPLLIDNKEPIWVQTAQSHLTALLLHYFYMGMFFIDAVMEIATTPPDKLIEEISRIGNTEAKIFINNFIGQENLSDSKFLLSVAQEITNKLSTIVTDPRVYNSLVPSENQIRWTDLETHNIFISVPEDKLDLYSPVLAMIITQLIRSLERRCEKYSPNSAKQPPILLMLDEFPRLGKMEAITTAVSTLRSKNVTICLVFQSLAQLDRIYGSETRRIILDNCTYKAILSVGDYESQRYFSNLTGARKVMQRSNTTSYDQNNQVVGHSTSVSWSRENHIQPHEFATLKDIILLTPNGYERVRKNPYYSTDTVIKLRRVIMKVISRVKSVFMQSTPERSVGKCQYVVKGLEKYKFEANS